MTKVEENVLNFLKKHLPIIMVGLALILGIIFRIHGMSFESGDYQVFLKNWWNILSEGDFSVLATQPDGCNYNIPYQTIVYILTSFVSEPLVAYKVLSIVFDVALAVGAALLVRTFTDKPSKFQTALMFSVVFCSLPVAFNSAFWAQCDSIYVAFIIFALYFLRKDKIVLSFLMLGFSLSFKLQVILILPFFIYYYVSTKKFSLVNILIIPIVDIVMCLPAVIAGRPFKDIFTIYFSQMSNDSALSLFYPNIYALFFKTKFGEAATIANYDMLKTPTICITFLILAIVLFAIINKGIDLRDSNKFLLTAIWSVFTCLMFLTSMHDRYAYLLDILLLIYVVAFGKKIWAMVTAHLVTLWGYGRYLFNEYAEPFPFFYVCITNIVLYVFITIAFYKEVICPEKEAGESK